MTDEVGVEFVHFISEERQANRFPASKEQLKEGELSPPIFVDNKRVSEFLRVAARRAVGLYRPTR